ncbi:hypothetical protein [Ruania alba]|uniref:Alpha glucuronidase N-terminal domain-containing protein n=1 Tax=Ruania alba TaxID=648782 RepID=A0A1H5KSE8_9MICO|nr:hypothetical protein [Ruania alba]SEE67732.1 hypothetical protein SAMN04488554_2426 [Ruania alba]
MPGSAQHTVVISPAADIGPAAQHGIEMLGRALAEAGVSLWTDPLGETARRPDDDELRIVVAGRTAPAILALERQEWLLYNTGEPGPNGFYLSMLPGRILVVTGADDAGVLYGCQELARIVTRHGGIPEDLDIGQTPDLALRGPAIGLQRTEVEPPRQVYEYPITPDRFEWFYDRDLWLEVLETLLAQRANVIYLWSGHPFASFVQTEQFPEALEVTPEELALNRETLAWLVAEAGRRGIRLFLMFYNIHIPLPFARHHDIPLHQPRPTELTSRYTRAVLTDFVTDFPQVGLYVCLGEVLQGDLYGTEWFTETILPAVEDGVAAAGVEEPPPILLRAHSLDPKPVIEATGSRYPALHTEAKYNGESLTTWNPRGKWQQTHRYLASLGGIHVVNIHILADLEPFRYGSVTFIQRSVQAIRHRLGSNGLHLYPLFYWEWPLSPDRVQPRLRQLDRDWIWFEAWHRYAWKSDRDADAERDYWTRRLAEQFGSERAGAAALETLEAMGQIAPRLVRRLGITEGNRQTLSLGMTLSQLTNPARHRAYEDLWLSHAPAGERLEEFVATEVAGGVHVGETPLDVVEEAVRFASRAGASVEGGRAAVRSEASEYERLASDAHAIALIADFYDLKVRAAVEILCARATFDGDHRALAGRLREAVTLVEASVAVYRRLAELTSRTYWYANSMQTPQRKIPFPNGKEFGHWEQCLPEYEAELEHLRANVEILARGDLPPAVAQRPALPGRFCPIDLTVHAGGEAFEVAEGSALFDDVDEPVIALAEELTGLRGIRFTKSAVLGGEASVEFSLAEEGHLLVGYFKDASPTWLQVPDLETNTHADDRGGLTPVLTSAVTVSWNPSVDVHAFRYEAGRHTFAPGGGAYVILGAVAADQEFTGRSVSATEREDSFDWLYENPIRSKA